MEEKKKSARKHYSKGRFLFCTLFSSSFIQRSTNAVKLKSAWNVFFLAVDSEINFCHILFWPKIVAYIHVCSILAFKWKELHLLALSKKLTIVESVFSTTVRFIQKSAYIGHIWNFTSKFDDAWNLWSLYPFLPLHSRLYK